MVIYMIISCRPIQIIHYTLVIQRREEAILFNVLNDAWIPARANKTCRNYSIRELIEHAHELDEVTDSQPLVELGLYRFLVAFISDALRLQDIGDKEDLLKEGRFNMDLIEEYISKCEDEGVSFDIFDPKNPFCQEPPREKKNIDYVTKLQLLPPEGNSFMNPDISQQRTMKPDEAIRRIVSIPLFPPGGSGYGSCISRTNCFFLVKGRNLFETLVLNIVPEDDFETGYGVPYWRMPKPVITENRNRTSAKLLEGMTFPLRLVNIGEEAEDISEIDFAAGLKFTDSAPRWKDPYVALNIKTNKEGKTTSEPLKTGQKPEPNSWMQIRTLFKDGDIPKIAHLNRDIEEIPLVIMMYALWNKQAKGLQMSKGEYVLSRDVLFDNMKRECVGSGIDTIGDFGNMLVGSIHSAISAVRNTKEKGPALKERKAEIKDMYLYRYYDACRLEFERQLSLGLPDYNEWIKSIKRESFKAYDEFENSFCNDAATMAAVMKAKAVMMKNAKRISNSASQSESGSEQNVNAK